MRDELDELLDRLRQTSERLEGISRILDVGGTVPHRSIAAIRPGRPFTLEGSVTYRLVTDDPDQVLLLLVMEAGGRVDWHDHDCPELGTVLWGRLLVDGRTYLPVEQYRFDPFVGHGVIAEIHTGILLEFPPPRVPGPVAR
jgi:hypothetical protein